MTRQKLLSSFFKNKPVQSITNDPTLLCWLSDHDFLRVNASTPIIVQDSQIAVFFMNQQMVAILEKGTYPWYWVFENPLLADSLANLFVYYFSTKIFSDQRWGTPTPILIQDSVSGILSLRAHGAFSYQLDNPKKLWRHIPGDSKQFSTEDIIDPLRSLILEQLAITLNNQPNLKDLLKDREALTQQLTQKVSQVFVQEYGLKLNSFQIQSLSLPEKDMSTMDNIAKLEKLNELYRQGILTEQEFEAKKKELLKGL